MAQLEGTYNLLCLLLFSGIEHREVEQAEQMTILDGRRQTRREPEERWLNWSGLPSEHFPYDQEEKRLFIWDFLYKLPKDIVNPAQK